MQIRTRLTAQFLLWGGIILIITLLAIYLLSAAYRKNNFYEQLTDRAWSVSKLLVDTYDFDAGRVRRIQRNDPLSLHDEIITIVNFRNETIYTSDENSRTEIPPDVIGQVRLGKRVRYREGRHEVVAVLYLSGFDRYVVAASALDNQGLSHLRMLGIIILTAFLISLAFFFIAGWIYSGRALKPISDVIKQVEHISITSLNLRVPEGNAKDEIGQLALTFNRMLERLERSFSMQKDFIANASHELRTPLTSINGQLEVLLMKERSAGDYKTALNSVLDDIRSLIELSNRLLLIARTSAEGPLRFHEKIRVDEILWLAKEDMKKTGEDRHIDISIDESLDDSDKMLITGDESLIKVAFSNIIDNACKYSADKSVKVQIRTKDKWISVIFKDNGIGIPDNELKKIFEPFYRGSNAQAVAGSGIGLPLVNQIINNHNGTVEIKSRTGTGTEVIINLPLAS